MVEFLLFIIALPTLFTLAVVLLSLPFIVLGWLCQLLD